jgi:hypothetical protein
MAVQNQVTFAICGGMNDLTRQHDAAKIHIDKLLQEFVMISGDVNDLRFLAAFAKQLLNENILIVLPMPLRPQLPAVNEIADQVQVAAIALAQKLQKRIDLRVLGAEVDVGNPHGTKAHFVRGERFRVCNHKLS